MRRPLIALGTVALAGLVMGGFALADGPQLTGSVGPGFVITLQDAVGAPVTHLDPGSYQLQVDDLSIEHNFHLQGPGGIDATTDVEGTGAGTFALTLVNGTYSFICDAHPTRMKGSFTVGTVTTPPPPPPPPASKLALTVTNTAITLRKAGVIVKSLAPGAYVVKVVDRSKKQNAHLLGAGVNRKTGIAFTGAVTWKVTLKAGKLVYRSDTKKPKLRGHTVVVP
jgi:hypothetical protein